MAGKHLRRLVVLLPVMIVVLILAACSGEATETGLLHGIVTIGPILPVEKQGEIPTVPCEVYEARKILVYDKNKDNLIKQLDIDCDGRYRAELKPGTYTIDINHIGIDTSSDVPKQIKITVDTTTRLDINIDTGIR